MGYEQIWAPWRLAYIQQGASAPDDRQDPLPLSADADPACFLCQAVADSDTRRRYVLRVAEHTVTLLNRYPYTNGHLLVAPAKHRGRLDELTWQEHAALAEEIVRVVGLLEKVLRPDGFNIGINLGRVAGAGLPGHLHWHVVPRWNGDTNFMPVLASVHVIPQSLDALWDALTEAGARQGG